MAERSPRPRYDAYGQKLPPLSPAERQDLRGSPQNQAMRRYLLHLLEQDYAHLFQRGQYAVVHLSFKVSNGTIQRNVHVRTHRNHDAPEE